MAAVDFDDMRFPQQFVLWASRQWVLHRSLPGWRQRLLLGGFTRLGIPDGAAALEQLMQALNPCSEEPLCFLRPCRHWVSEDECAFLGILAALQSGLNGTATERLGDWCAPVKLRRAFSAGKRLTALLSGAGLQLGTTPRREHTVQGRARPH